MTWIVTPGPLHAGDLRVPGDKSITHRAYLFGALASGETEVSGPNPGADVEATLTACASLGVGVERVGDAVRLRGTGGRLREPGGVLDCGNSGTTLRLLSGALAGRPLFAVLTGDDSLRRRPVDRVIAPLRKMGARLSARAADTLPPLVVLGADLHGERFDTPTHSAQVATALLLAGLAAGGETSVAVAGGVRDHTVGMLRAFGVEVEVETAPGGASRWRVTGPATPRGTRVVVPGDPSAAAFFMAAAAITPGLAIGIEQVNLNPTRLGFVGALEAMGVEVRLHPSGTAAGEPVGSIEVVGPAHLRAADVPGSRVASMVDEVPAWAVVAAFARGVSRLSGAAELRVKESDRLAALAANLGRLGVTVDERPDGLAITGGVPGGGEVRALGDHRLAMAFAVLGTRAGGAVTIDDPRAVATSFPGFADALRGLGGRLEPAEGAWR